ncbi:hypothetical protein FQR65_LT10793 [Abscondita terminalis]|nr:hypothetical protein FQR65_LT10793 [Abscondita terminalis]
MCRYNVRFRIYLSVLTVVFGVFSYLTSVYDVATLFAEMMIEMTANSIIFTLWLNPPYEIYLKFYLFNVTNVEEFLNYDDKKLMLNEVGPYTYRQFIYNKNVSFEDDGTLTFTPTRKIAFVPELSVGNPITDALLVPNLPLLGITASLDEYSMAFKLAIAQIASMLDSKSFVNVSVEEYLFGYDDTLVALANNLLPNWIDFGRFGIIDRLMALENGTSVVNVLVAKRGNKTLYNIEKFNGEFGLAQWGHASECYSLNDLLFIGTVFPPKLEENSSLILYSHAFCRPLPVKFNKSDSSKYGFDAYTFNIENNKFLARGSEYDCSSDTIRRTLPNGIGYISPCYYDMPFAVSQPHFLNADSNTMSEKIDGMKPDPAMHDFYLTIHPTSGLPLEAKMRLQINLCMPYTRFNSRTKPFNDLILPLFWVEQSVDGPPTLIYISMYFLYVILPVAQELVKYMLMIITTICFVALVYTVLSCGARESYAQVNVNEVN